MELPDHLSGIFLQGETRTRPGRVYPIPKTITTSSGTTYVDMEMPINHDWINSPVRPSFPTEGNRKERRAEASKRRKNKKSR